MPVKKIAVVALVIMVALGGFGTGIYLLQQRQDINEQAATPNGDATVSLSPNSGDFNVGDTIRTTVNFNTANIPVSGIAVRLAYPFTGQSPEISVNSVTINSGLTSSGDWTCPTQSSSNQAGQVLIDIACANTSARGYTNNSNTALATVELKVNRAPSTSPVVLRFDPTLSVVTRKSDNQDILLIPSSQGSFNIAGATQATSTPTRAGTATPTSRTTATPTRVATGTVTTTGTKTPTTTKTPTPTREVTETETEEELPDAGVSMPTLLILSFGFLAIVGAIVLAL